MTRRLRASPATRAAVHHDPRPKEYCPKHGPAYPAEGCEQCAREAKQPPRSTDDVAMLRGVLERTKAALQTSDFGNSGDLLAEITEALKATDPDPPSPVKRPCRVTLEGRILEEYVNGTVHVHLFLPWGAPCLAVPKKAVTPLVEVKA